MHLEIVEPTLVSEAGHCAAVFASLRHAAPDLPYRLWIDRHASVPDIERQGVALQRYFSRRWRKLQSVWLYRQLLRKAAPILIPTATWLDLNALDLVASGTIPAGRAFLYFHKWRPAPRRAAALEALARRQPHLHLFGTSPMIVQALRSAGFARVDEIPPVLGSEVSQDSVPFRALLSAGAARADKGFAQVVDLIEHLAAVGSDLPIVVQTSGDHYGRYDDSTRQQLQRLRHIGYRHLTELADTLDAQQYQHQFEGSICLQPYERDAYCDKMSSVTFDALRHAAPIITTAGTTMATLVERTGAGIVLDAVTAAAMLQASHEIRDRYGQFSERARQAAQARSAAMAWKPLVEQLQLACRAA